MAEYFSPSGSSKSTSAVGVINDPNYTVYVGITGSDTLGKGTAASPFRTPYRALDFLEEQFITQNGFATIFCGKGRYILDKSIEIRHPQGDRIGIKGDTTKDYILAKCDEWYSSHARKWNPDGTVNSTTNHLGQELSGTTACRYYTTTVRLNPVDWETTGNKLTPGTMTSSDGIGIDGGLSGEYVLVRDWTHAHSDNYDVVHQEYGMDSGTHSATDGIGEHRAPLGSGVYKNQSKSRRISLCGAHPIYGNTYGVADSDGGVSYTCHFYNYPVMWNYATVEEGIARRAWYGGYINTGGWEYDIISAGNFAGDSNPDSRGFDMCSNPYPSVMTQEQAAWNYNPTRFGNTAEGWTNVPTTEDFLGNQTGVHQRTIRGVRPTQEEHCSLNRMILTHVPTVFEFTSTEKPGIVIEGGHLGFIQNLAIEGKWKQFSKHRPSTGNTGGNANSMEEWQSSQVDSRDFAGILVTNHASLSYDLGLTADSQAKTEYEGQHTSVKLIGEELTIHNVGINGFDSGVCVMNNSSATLNDIVISNCDSGIFVERNSNVIANRCVIVGCESYANRTTQNSNIMSARGLVGQIGCPLLSVTFKNRSTSSFLASSPHKFRDSTFFPGQPVAIVDTSQPGHVGEHLGIVKYWFAPGGRPGEGVVGIYDNLKKWYKDLNEDGGSDLFDLDSLKDLIDTNGLTQGVDAQSNLTYVGGLTACTIAEDTNPSTGYLEVASVGGFLQGSGFHIDTNSTGMLPECSVHYVHAAAFRSHTHATIRAFRCAATHCMIGFAAHSNSYAQGSESLALNIPFRAYECGYGSYMKANQATVENATQPFAAHYGAHLYAPYITHIRGLTDSTSHTYTILGNSTFNRKNGRYVGEAIAGVSDIIDGDAGTNWTTLYVSNDSFDYSG